KEDEERGRGAGVEGTDEALVSQIQAGDVRAFEALVRRHQDRIFSVAYRMLGNAADAEEAASAAFLKVYRHAASYDARWKVTTWLGRLVANCCVDHHRRRLRQARTPDPPPGHSDGRATSPEENYTATERRRLLEEALLTLPAETRLILSLRYAQGLSLGEVARARGMGEEAVKGHLKRGKAALRRRLGRLGIEGRKP
ncbi:MAG: sigma-70 family RNA polymerase sigma factor, partial [candidate division NC10 bacterium]|nr:sigma-70 family RNA polymerase sigma factor [candidate division NC10 bacterium]